MPFYLHNTLQRETIEHPFPLPRNGKRIFHHQFTEWLRYIVQRMTHTAAINPEAGAGKKPEQDQDAKFV